MNDWPINSHGKYACPCCGYHTLVSAPGSHDICPVCSWEEDAPSLNQWDTSIWGGANHMNIEVAWANYERLGICKGWCGEHCRGPLPDELPRHDWKADTRLHGFPIRGGVVMWVFTPEGANSPSGVWDSKPSAEAWINRVSAEGILSAYVLNESAYDSNVRLGLLKVDDGRRLSPNFMKSFTTAVDHCHYGRDASKG